MEVLSEFSQFGLVGIVIGALFIVIWFLMREIRTIIADCNKQIAEHMSAHGLERAQWLEAFRRCNDQVRDLTNKIDKLEK